MKVIYFQALSRLLLVLMLGQTGCNAERVAVGPAPPREQEVMRFQSTDLTSQPVLFGQVSILDKTKISPLSSAIISLDNKLTYADEAGRYRLILKPGRHEFMTGQIGIYQSRLILDVKPGDSVRINFHLRPDLRPLN